jgi:hypothetical protein
MALGDNGAGVGPFGFDPVVSTTSAESPGFSALYVDLAARSTLFDAQGFAVGTHPVDQEAALTLGVELGALSSSPAFGFDYERLRRASAIALQATAEDEARVRYAAAVARGDMRIEKVTCERRPHGRLLLAVHYTNLRTARAEIATGSSAA